MSNKNFNHNDHESFMEGIYGCLERIETFAIQLLRFLFFPSIRRCLP